MSDGHETIEDQFDGRVTELVLLNSMYPGQLDLDDSHLQSQVQSEIVTAQCSQPISGLFLVNKTLEVYFVLPLDYPEAERPTVHCRIVDGRFIKALQKELNEDIAPLVVKDINLIEILQTIIKKWDDLDLSAFTVNTNCRTNNKPINEVSKEMCRYWIYSHHIKSKVKRKLIVDLSKDLNLTGFMLIGKPGFICIEGNRDDCESLWSQIRQLSWQRISLVETETLAQISPRAFETFTEQMDRSVVFQTLQVKGCDNILKNVLGIK